MVMQKSILTRKTCMFLQLIIVAFVVFSGNALATEEPKYKIIEKVDQFELRSYEAKIIAEVAVAGSMDEASSKGFRLIADFIFGNNVSQNGAQDKISMTAPVTMEAQSEQSEKVSMTTPVAMAQLGEKWLVHFVMPSKYTLDTLPKPINSAVNIREIPARKYAVLRFSGFTGAKKVDKKTAELLEWMADKGLHPSGQPELARYNPPITPPFLRRNEVMVAY
jgi:effector-binding domain-containing protein